MPEYFFGFLRVRSNSDARSVQHMMQITNKLTALQDLLRKYGWVSGMKARCYSATSSEEKHKPRAFAKEGEAISHDEHISIMNAASEAVKRFLTKPCQASEAEVSPMCRAYGSMTELADHLEKLFQKTGNDKAEEPVAEAEDTALASHEGSFKGL